MYDTKCNFSAHIMCMVHTPFNILAKTIRRIKLLLLAEVWEAVFSRWGGGEFVKIMNYFKSTYINCFVCEASMRQGPLLSVPGTNNLIVPRGTNISQTLGQDTHFSHMGMDILSFYTGGETLLSHSGGGQTFLYTGGRGDF